MKTLSEVVQNLPSISAPQEEVLYLFSDLRAALINIELLSVKNEWITPSYVCDGKRMEFYYAALHILPVEKCDFAAHLLNITGKRSLSEISDEVVSLQKQCYVEVQKTHPLLPTTRIIQYI